MSFHFLLPLSSQAYLFFILVWHIKGLCLGGLVLWYPVFFGALKAMCLGLLHILCLGKNISAVYLFACFCQFAEIAPDACHPSPLLHFCKWENLVPICIALPLVLLNWGLTDLGPGVQPLLQVA